MTCREFWNRMPELQAESGVAEHLQHCPSCAALMADQRMLAAGLNQIARDREGVEAPAGLESTLREAFRKQAGAGFASPARRKPIPWLAWAPAMAAAIILVFVLGPNRHPQPLQTSHPDATVADPATVDPDFVPLPDSADPGVAGDPDLVRVEVPRSALVALGLPLGLDADGGPVEAEVALGADGMMRGIRILQ